MPRTKRRPIRSSASSQRHAALRLVPSSIDASALPPPLLSGEARRQLVSMARSRIPVLRAEIEFWHTVLHQLASGKVDPLPVAAAAQARRAT